MSKILQTIFYLFCLFSNSYSSLKFNIPNNREKCFAQEFYLQGTLLVRYDLKGIELIKPENQEKAIKNIKIFVKNEKGKNIHELFLNSHKGKFAIYIRSKGENGKSLTKNVKHETVNRILGIKDISMAGSPVSYSKKLGYYVELDFGVNDDTKNLAEIIEPLVAIALRLNLEDYKESISEIARYLAYKGDGKYYANYLADAWFEGRCILDVSGNVVEILECG